MPGFKQVTDTQTDWQQGTLSNVVATAAGDLELGLGWDEVLDFNALPENLGTGWKFYGSSAYRSISGGIMHFKDSGTDAGQYAYYWLKTNLTSSSKVTVEARTTRIVSNSDGLQPAIEIRDQDYYASLQLYPTYIRLVSATTTQYAVDMTVPRVVRFIKNANSWSVLLDGARVISSEVGKAETEGWVGLRFGHFSAAGTGESYWDYFCYTLNGAYEKGPYAASGTRVSPVLDLSPVGIAASSSISWNATTPLYTSVKVETRLSLDGGATWQAWQQATNGGPIPGITAGMDLRNARLQTRVTLSTTEKTTTPRLHSLTVVVPAAGSRTAPLTATVGVARSVSPPVRVQAGVARSASPPVRVQAGVARSRSGGVRAIVVAVSRRVPPHRRIRARLFIGRPDGITWEDVTEYLASARISLGDVRALGTGNEGVDERVRTAAFVLRQDRVPGGPSLSPRDRTSPWNQHNGQYAPLIWPRRQVLFDCCVEGIGDVPPNQHVTRRWAELVGFGDGTTTVFQLRPWPVEPGTEAIYINGVAKQRDMDYTIDYATGQVTFAAAPPAGLPITADYTYWLPVFEGLIDDWRTDGPTVEFNCRDLSATLQDTYIEVTRTYGSGEGTPLEQVIQQILDDNLGAGVVQLYCPRSPGFAVRPYNVEYQSVWDAIQSAVIKTIGWYLGYWLDPATNRFRLALLEPPRHKGPQDADWELDYRDDIYVNDLGGSIADVRNVVRVTFRNTATGKRETITVEDPASIAQYGRRAMQIEEADASLIDTPEEAMALAVAAVSDLKDQHATANLELPCLPMLSVMDGVVVRDDRVSSTADFFAVESVEHALDFDGGRFRTTAVCSGRVVGAHSRWMEMQTRPGAQQPTRMVAADAVEVTQAQPPIPQTIKAYSIPMGVEVVVPAPNIRGWRITRVRLKGAPGGSVLATYEARATRFAFAGLTVGRTYYADAQYEDTEGGTSPWSVEASAIAGGNIVAVVLEAREYVKLPVLSADPTNPPNGAMWMRA